MGEYVSSIKHRIESFVQRYNLSKWENICSYWMKYSLANRGSLWIIMLCINIAVGLSSRSKNSGVYAVFIITIRHWPMLNAYLSWSFVTSHYHGLWVLLNIKQQDWISDMVIYWNFLLTCLVMYLLWKSFLKIFSFFIYILFSSLKLSCKYVFLRKTLTKTSFLFPSVWLALSQILSDYRSLPSLFLEHLI